MAKNAKQEKREWKRRKREKAHALAPPKLGHESMVELVSGLAEAAQSVIESRRQVQPAAAAGSDRVERGATEQSPCLMGEADLARPDVRAFLSDYFQWLQASTGWDRESCVLEVEQLCSHLSTVVDFELGGKKAFWVSEELSEQLAATTLDIGGDLLNLPFACCAFVFRDAAALELAQELSAGSSKRAAPRVVTVYARRIPPDYEEDGLRFTFLFDGFDGEWPYMLLRDIPTEGTKHLDEILNSHPEESHDPVFRSAAMQQLVKLAINAVLYTTCDACDTESRAAAPRGPRKLIGTLSGEDVFFLPGRIAIGARNGSTDEPQGRSGRSVQRSVQKRFWVRGHWRRPNPSWKDQRLRWVRPHLKGPDMAAIVQRDYELVGRGMPSEDPRRLP